MRKKILALALIMALLCAFGQFVFADIANPFPTETKGNTFAVVLLIAVLIAAVVFIIRKIRKRR